MKPEYSDQTTNLDVCVVGAYYGDGNRRSGLLSHFLLAVVDQNTLPPDGSEPSDVNKTKWFTMGKVCFIIMYMCSLLVSCIIC
jgi:ATP-dependent DNA ligase